jgi:hypothetical protein
MTKARDLANASTALSAVSATELAFLDGVTSAVQTQIDGKQAVNANVSTTELGYLDGVTSAIQTQLDAKIAKTLTTTTGDIIYASGANTPARLGIGSSAQVLTVASGVPSWATPAGGGGYTLINSGGTTLTGANVTISSIPNTYQHLFILVTDMYLTTNNGALYFCLNADNNSNYGLGLAQAGGATNNQGATGGGEVPTNTSSGNNNTNKQKTFSAIWVYRYTDTSPRMFSAQTYSYNGTANTTTTNGMWNNSSAAVSSLKFFGDSNFQDGKVYVYGVN